MIAVYILLGLLLLLLLCSLVKVTINICYVREAYLTVKILFFTLKFRLYTPNAKEEKNTDTESLKKAGRAKKKKKPNEVKRKPTLKELIDLIKVTFVDLFGKFKKYLRLEKFCIRIRVATDDPADTAVLYGAISAAVYPITVFTLSIKNRNMSDEAIYAEVIPDFIGDSFDLYADISLSLKIWQILHVGLRSFLAFLKYTKLTEPEKLKNKQPEKQQEEQETQEKQV